MAQEQPQPTDIAQKNPHCVTTLRDHSMRETFQEFDFKPIIFFLLFPFEWGIYILDVEGVKSENPLPM